MYPVKTYKNSQILFNFIIEIPKEQSYFVYFTLESLEGICFYSTLDNEVNDPWRRLDIKGSIEYKTELLSIFNEFQKIFSLNILSERFIQE